MKADAAFPTVSTTTTNAAASSLTGSSRIGSDLLKDEARERQGGHHAGQGAGPVGLGLAFDSISYADDVGGSTTATDSAETLDAHTAKVDWSTCS